MKYALLSDRCSYNSPLIEKLGLPFNVNNKVDCERLKQVPEL